jgi:hypothetical protein
MDLTVVEPDVMVHMEPMCMYGCTVSLQEMEMAWAFPMNGSSAWTISFLYILDR